MITLRKLFHFMPDDRHPRAVARDRMMMFITGATLAAAYAWAVFCILYKD